MTEPTIKMSSQVSAAPREIAVVRIGNVANIAPTIDLDASSAGTGYSLTFTGEGDGPTDIADSGDTDLVDGDSTTFASVKLAVSGLLDGNAETLTLDGDTFMLATAVAGQDTDGRKLPDRDVYQSLEQQRL